MKLASKEIYNLQIKLSLLPFCAYKRELGDENHIVYFNGIDKENFLTGEIRTLDKYNQVVKDSATNEGSYAFNGLIDDVRIYDRALSAEEVQALYNMGQ